MSGLSDHNQVTQEILANPVPLGLIGLSIGAAPLVPISFGYGITPQGLNMAAIVALLFGGGCQFLAGLMCYLNKNVFGGTLFTAFSFMWVFNYWTLSSLTKGFVPEPSLALAMDVTLLIIFGILTYAHGFFSSVLFAFLLDIALIFGVRVLKIVFSYHWLDPLLGLLTIGMILISLWLAFGILMNPLLKKNVFSAGKPVFA